MEVSPQIVKTTPNENFNEEKIIKESKYELNYENNNFILILILTECNLIFKLKEKNIISSKYYISKNNLDDLIKIDKQFRAYDTINEIFELLIDILNINQAFIQKKEDYLVIKFLFPLPGNKKKEIIIPLHIENFEQKNINDELVKKVNDLEDKLNKEIEENKIYKKIINENKKIINENQKIINENKNIINELKEEIKILKNEINDLKNWKKEKIEKKEKEKESNIIKDKKEYEFIENRLKLAGNNRDIRYKLLYRASKDGDKAKTFHEKCNGIKGTLCLVETTDNIKLGGYTEALWDGSGFKKDDKAFCFSLNLKKIYNVGIPEYAIQPRENYGPRFANTLFGIENESFKKGEKGGWCSYTSDKAYGIIEKTYEITGGKEYFGVKEVEVFQIIFK